MEKNIKKNNALVYNWVTSLHSRDWHNIVLINHLYFNKEIVVKNKNKNLQKLEV